MDRIITFADIIPYWIST